MYQSQLKATGEEISQVRHNAARLRPDTTRHVGQLGTWDPLVITTRVDSNGITTIMVHFKESFEKALDALMTLRASMGRV